ncbi:MAG: four-carbon acid sugar kinase family protein, partial [Nitrospira sp.]|nr:four-carbon acid sugar kinase family protein [Nitrospira sp.]
TRHLSSAESYKLVYDIVRRAVTAGISIIFKKTDSVLRGNIGSELAAVLDASGEKLLSFIPAYPRMSRVTMNGTQYVKGIPAEKSVFGIDPYEPVRCSYIPDIIRQQTNTPVYTVPLNELENLAPKTGIYVFDSVTDEDLHEVVSNLQKWGLLKVMAGCAGLASVLPQILGLKSNPPVEPKLTPPLMVVCGSVNEITRKQLIYAEKHGFRRITLTSEQRLNPLFTDSIGGRKILSDLFEMNTRNFDIMIDTNDPGNNSIRKHAKERNLTPDEIRLRTAKTLGKISKKLVDMGAAATMLVTGGDTLVAVLHELDCLEISPLFEVEPGIVYSKFMYRAKILDLISKSGGFGDERLLVRLADKARQRKGDNDI